MKMDNKVIIITGAGSGIGKAAAFLFSKEGANLVLADINSAGGEETVASIKANGGKAIFVHTDVSIASEVERLVKAGKDSFGGMDILFNNAGIFTGQVAVEDVAESLWDHVYAVNVRSIFLTVKYVVPDMKKAGGGVIINTASMLGFRPAALVSTYASSKGAVITLTKALALELAPYHIRVNCILPTLTDTPMVGMYSEEAKKAIAKTIPLGRLAKPEEIANAALYLASDEASIVTGSCISLDGGEGI